MKKRSWKRALTLVLAASMLVGQIPVSETVKAETVPSIETEEVVAKDMVALETEAPTTEPTSTPTIAPTIAPTEIPESETSPVEAKTYQNDYISIDAAGKLTIENTETDYTSVDAKDFLPIDRRCTVTSINFNGVTQLMPEAFKDCNNLTIVKLPDNTVLSVGEFEGCSSLRELWGNVQDGVFPERVLKDTPKLRFIETSLVTVGDEGLRNSFNRLDLNEEISDFGYSFIYTKEHGAYGIDLSQLSSVGDYGLAFSFNGLYMRWEESFGETNENYWANRYLNLLNCVNLGKGAFQESFQLLGAALDISVGATIIPEDAFKGAFSGTYIKMNFPNTAEISENSFSAFSCGVHVTNLKCRTQKAHETTSTEDPRRYIDCTIKADQSDIEFYFKSIEKDKDYDCRKSHPDYTIYPQSTISMPKLESGAYNAFNNAFCYSFVKLNMPALKNNTEKMFYEAFSHVGSQAVIHLDSLETVGKDMFHGAFYKAMDLELYINSATSAEDGAFKNAFAANTQSSQEYNEKNINKIYAEKLTDLGKETFYTQNASYVNFANVPNVVNVGEGALQGRKLYHFNLSHITNVAQNGMKDTTLWNTLTTNLDSINSVGDRAFDGSDITDEFLPKIINQTTSVGDYVFSNCGKISDVDVSKNDAYITNRGTFNNSGIQTIKYNKETVASIGDACFNGCASLTSFDFPVLEDVTIGASAFANTGLTQIDFSSKKNGLTLGTNAFYNSNIKTANLNFGSTGKLSLIIGDGAFFGNPIESIDMNIGSDSESAAPSVLQIGARAFERTPLKGTVSLGVHGSVAIGNNAFYACPYLTGFDLSNQKFGAVRLGDNVFSWSALESFCGPDSAPGDLIMGAAFENAKELKSFKTYTITALTKCGPTKDHYSLPIFKDDRKLETVDITTGWNYSWIPCEAFKNCVSLSKLSIGSDVQYVGEEAFYNCPNLGKANLDLTHVKNMWSKAFYNCNLGDCVNLPAVSMMYDDSFADTLSRNGYIVVNPTVSIQEGNTTTNVDTLRNKYALVMNVSSSTMKNSYQSNISKYYNWGYVYTNDEFYQNISVETQDSEMPITSKESLKEYLKVFATGTDGLKKQITDFEIRNVSYDGVKKILSCTVVTSVSGNVFSNLKDTRNYGEGVFCEIECPVTLAVNQILPEITSITLDKTYINLRKGEKYVLKKTVDPSSPFEDTVWWTSSDSGVAKVKQDGTVIAKSNGTAVITCYYRRNMDEAVAGHCEVVVGDGQKTELTGTASDKNVKLYEIHAYAGFNDQQITPNRNYEKTDVLNPEETYYIYLGKYETGSDLLQNLCDKTITYSVVDSNGNTLPSSDYTFKTDAETNVTAFTFTNELRKNGEPFYIYAKYGVNKACKSQAYKSSYIEATPTPTSMPEVTATPSPTAKPTFKPTSTLSPDMEYQDYNEAKFLYYNSNGTIYNAQNPRIINESSGYDYFELKYKAEDGTIVETGKDVKVESLTIYSCDDKDLPYSSAKVYYGRNYVALYLYHDNSVLRSGNCSKHMKLSYLLNERKVEEDLYISAGYKRFSSTVEASQDMHDYFYALNLKGQDFAYDIERYYDDIPNPSERFWSPTWKNKYYIYMDEGTSIDLNQNNVYNKTFSNIPEMESDEPDETQSFVNISIAKNESGNAECGSYAGSQMNGTVFTLLRGSKTRSLSADDEPCVILINGIEVNVLSSQNAPDSVWSENKSLEYDCKLYSIKDGVLTIKDGLNHYEDLPSDEYNKYLKYTQTYSKTDIDSVTFEDGIKKIPEKSYNFYYGANYALKILPSDFSVEKSQSKLKEFIIPSSVEELATQTLYLAAVDNVICKSEKITTIPKKAFSYSKIGNMDLSILDGKIKTLGRDAFCQINNGIPADRQSIILPKFNNVEKVDGNICSWSYFPNTDLDFTDNSYNFANKDYFGGSDSITYYSLFKNISFKNCDKVSHLTLYEAHCRTLDLSGMTQIKGTVDINSYPVGDGSLCISDGQYDKIILPETLHTLGSRGIRNCYIGEMDTSNITTWAPRSLYDIGMNNGQSNFHSDNHIPRISGKIKTLDLRNAKYIDADAFTCVHYSYMYSYDPVGSGYTEIIYPKSLSIFLNPKEIAPDIQREFLPRKTWSPSAIDYGNVYNETRKFLDFFQTIGFNKNSVVSGTEGYYIDTRDYHDTYFSVQDLYNIYSSDELDFMYGMDNFNKAIMYGHFFTTSIIAEDSQSLQSFYESTKNVDHAPRIYLKSEYIDKIDVDLIDEYHLSDNDSLSIQDFERLSRDTLKKCVKVTATFRDGSTRILDQDEYELSYYYDKDDISIKFDVTVWNLPVKYPYLQYNKKYERWQSGSSASDSYLFKNIKYKKTKSIDGVEFTDFVYAVNGLSLDKNEVTVHDAADTSNNFKLNATLSPKKVDVDKVFWASSDEDVATVDEEGNVSIHNDGETEITATSLDGGYYDTCDLTVQEKIDDVSISGPDSIILGENGQYAAEVSGTSLADKKVTWSVSGNQSTDTTVDSAGKLTIGADESALSVRLKATSNYDPTKFAEKDVVVKQRIDGVTVSGAKRVARGTVETYSAEVTGTTYADKTVTWSLSGNNSQDTTLDNTGKLTIALNESSDKLTVTAVSNGDPSKKDSVDVTVERITGITIQAKDEMKPEESQKCTATVVTTNDDVIKDKTILWNIIGNSSPDTKIEPDGKLTVGADENADKITVTATSKVDPSISATKDVVIKQFVTDISIHGKDVIRPTEESLYIADVTGSENADKTVTWTVTGAAADSTTINTDGILKVSAEETAKKLTITATSNEDPGVKVSKDVRVEQFISGLLIEGDNTAYPEDEKVYIAHVDGSAAADKKVTWSISDNQSEQTVIDADGKLIIGKDETAKTISVKAVSNMDPSKEDTKAVLIKSRIDKISVSGPDEIECGKENTYVSEVTGTYNADKTVIWTVSGNSSDNTAINEDGKLYCGPDESSDKITVIATSKQNPDIFGTKDVIVTKCLPTPTPVPTGSPAPSNTPMPTLNPGNPISNDVVNPTPIPTNTPEEELYNTSKDPDRIPGTIELKIPTITMKKNMGIGKKFQIKLLNQKGAVIKTSSSNKKVATINKNGIVKAKKAGKTTVIINMTKGKYRMQYIVKINVKKKVPFNYSLIKYNTKYKNVSVCLYKLLRKGKSYKITMKHLAKKDKVAFSSSNSKVISVDKKGKCTSHKSGKAIITIKMTKGKRVFTYFMVVRATEKGIESNTSYLKVLK